MNVSYLILAHNNFVHLERLIDELSSGQSRIYVHVDERVGYPPHLQSKPGVHFIEDRTKVFWGGFSMITATLSLMRRAIADGFGDYYALISGTDYPVKSKEAFHRQLALGGEYINLMSPGKIKPRWRFMYYHFDNFDRRAYLHPRTVLFHTAEILLKLIPRKSDPPFRLSAGSQWFALSRACVNHLVHVVDNDEQYKRFFRNTLFPDEAFFQTIISNSRFLQQVRPNLTYSKWQHRLGPAGISAADVNLLAQKQFFSGVYGTFEPFFARKFSDTSGELITHIKNKLLAPGDIFRGVPVPKTT